jgi:hypothetical protein
MRLLVYIFQTNVIVCFLQTNRFGICLAVRTVGNWSPSSFAFQPVLVLLCCGVDVACDDILQNYMGKDDQLMNKEVFIKSDNQNSNQLAPNFELVEPRFLQK